MKALVLEWEKPAKDLNPMFSGNPQTFVGDSGKWDSLVGTGKFSQIALFHAEWHNDFRHLNKNFQAIKGILFSKPILFSIIC